MSSLPITSLAQFLSQNGFSPEQEDECENLITEIFREAIQKEMPGYDPLNLAGRSFDDPNHIHSDGGNSVDGGGKRERSRRGTDYTWDTVGSSFDDASIHSDETAGTAGSTTTRQASLERLRVGPGDCVVTIVSERPVTVEEGGSKEGDLMVLGTQGVSYTLFPVFPVLPISATSPAATGAVVASDASPQ